jgi:hypothetical protein
MRGETKRTLEEGFVSFNQALIGKKYNNKVESWVSFLPYSTRIGFSTSEAF